MFTVCNSSFAKKDLIKGYKLIKKSKKIDFVLSISKFNSPYHRGAK